MGHSPEWGMLIVLYFFFGGIAAGAYFTAALADLFGDEHDQPAVKAGYLLAFPLTLLLPVLLIADLGSPLRALNMFLSFDLRSPMSVGSWALLGFGGFSAVSAYLVSQGDKAPWGPQVRRQIGLVGALFGFFIASYTGVLLGTTNRPVWSGSNLLGALFLTSGASTGVSAIALYLLAQRSLGARLWSRLRALDEVVVLLEVVLIAVFLGALGKAGAPILSGGFAWLFWVGVLGIGLVLPFGLQFGMTFFPSRVQPTGKAIAVAGVLLLVGGFALRYLVLMAGQA